jgi:5-methylcytosine-specific restriction enzyme B
MGRYCGDRDPEPLIAAAAFWRQVAFVGDGSVFSEQPLWTEANAATLVREFVEKPDESKDRFLEKLKRQLEPANAAAKRLAAEVQWLLWLAPSNLKAATKIDDVREIWSWSGEACPESQWLDPMRLEGVGSAGQGIINYRWSVLVSTQSDSYPDSPVVSVR